MCWLAATIGWLKNALCVGVNSKNSGLGLKNSSGWRRLAMHCCLSSGPNKLQKLLIRQLALELPAQTPPRITSRRSLEPLPSQTLL